MRWDQAKASILALLACTLVSCDGDSTTSPAARDDIVVDQKTDVVEVEVDVDNDEGSASNEPGVELSVASWEEIQAKVVEHKGKVVVLDLWSTSCVPCLQELPKLAELQKQHPDTVVCMSVSIDYTGAEDETPESHRDDVMKKLKPRNMTVQNFISSTTDFDVYEKIDLGSIPAVMVYDREGKLLKRFDNDMNEYGEEGFTYAEHIVPLVEKTLGEEL